MTNKEIRQLIEEGLMDKMRSAFGLKTNDDSAVGLKTNDGYNIIPKKQWEELMKYNYDYVNTLANTPDPRDAYKLVENVLEQLVKSSNSMEARKAQRDIRDAKRNKDGRRLADIIVGIQREADRIRSVRSLRHDPDKIAEMIGDIGINNGFLI